MSGWPENHALKTIIFNCLSEWVEAVVVVAVVAVVVVVLVVVVGVDLSRFGWPGSEHGHEATLELVSGANF